MDTIISYLTKQYDPDAIIVYGSYMDGSQDADSDFDAVVITGCTQKSHDDLVIDGVRLDVFLYSPEAKFSCEDFVQIYDGRILLDRNGKGAQLQKRVREYIDNIPPVSSEEIGKNLSWCRKMLLRARRADAEGLYRWHWLLCDSLQIYCDIRGDFYFGPKKTLKKMEWENPEAFRIYREALELLHSEKLERWIDYLEHEASVRVIQG